MSCQSPKPSTLSPPLHPVVQDAAPGWEAATKKGGLLAFQAAVFYREQSSDGPPARLLAANVLAADGGEASKFTLTAERNRAEHLLMNERAAH